MENGIFNDDVNVLNVPAKARIEAALTRVHNMPDWPDGCDSRITCTLNEFLESMINAIERTDKGSETDDSISEELKLLRNDVDLQAIRTSALTQNTSELNSYCDSASKLFDKVIFDCENLECELNDADRNISDIWDEVNKLQDSMEDVSDRVYNMETDIQDLIDHNDALANAVQDLDSESDFYSEVFLRMVDFKNNINERLTFLENECQKLHELYLDGKMEMDEVAHILTTVEHYNVVEFHEKMEEAVQAAHMLIGFERKMDRLWPVLSRLEIPSDNELSSFE